MQIVIEISEKDIPKHGQGMITVHIDFHTGELCRCTHPCKVLQKGHGRLIDADEMKRAFPIMENGFGMVFNKSINEYIDNALIVIPTDKEG